MYLATYQTSYFLFHWMFCFSWAMASGLSFYAPMHQAWGFFPDRPGFASGLIISGFGGGGLIFNNLSTSIINPENISISDPLYNETIKAGFPMMIRKLMVYWFAIITIGLLLVWKSPPKPEVNNSETSDETKKEVS